MLAPIIRRPRRNEDPHHKQRGVTIALVALAMVSIISMAALSIDIGTFYEAKAEAQRAADAAALTAARVISLSGITGDPLNSSSSWQPTCGGSSSAATIAATAVAQVQQNFVGRTVGTVSVKYGAASPTTDCSSLAATSFGVNPIVTVTVQRTNLPIFFGRIFSLVGSTYSGASVSATATAEAFNPSGSSAYAPATVPVQPRCVKPWIVPNSDPGNLPNPFVNTANGSIVNPGIELNYAPPGVIGESFNLTPDCGPNPATCIPLINPTPQATAGNLQYLPGLVSNPAPAAPSCATGNYQQAIAGCDESTAYQCGVLYSTASNPNQVDLTNNPKGPAGDTATAVQCLIHEASPGLSSTGQDVLLVSQIPYQIQAGSSNPLNISGSSISSSNSIVSLPIYDSTASLPVIPQPPVTIVGFLQVFINYTDAAGNPNVTVLNVAGCGNTVPATTQALSGTSPVPVRLITPP